MLQLNFARKADFCTDGSVQTLPVRHRATDIRKATRKQTNFAAPIKKIARRLAPHVLIIVQRSESALVNHCSSPLHYQQPHHCQHLMQWTIMSEMRDITAVEICVAARA
jgi:hypothetical protein